MYLTNQLSRFHKYTYLLDNSEFTNVNFRRQNYDKNFTIQNQHLNLPHFIALIFFSAHVHFYTHTIMHDANTTSNTSKTHITVTIILSC